MAVKRSEIEDTKQTVEGLAMMARKLGYKSEFGQLMLNNGCSVSDILEHFEDNPGAIEAIVEWQLDENRDRDGEEFLDEDDSDSEDEEEDFSQYKCRPGDDTICEPCQLANKGVSDQECLHVKEAREGA